MVCHVALASNNVHRWRYELIASRKKRLLQNARNWICEHINKAYEAFGEIQLREPDKPTVYREKIEWIGWLRLLPPMFKYWFLPMVTLYRLHLDVSPPIHLSANQFQTPRMPWHYSIWRKGGHISSISYTKLLLLLLLLFFGELFNLHRHRRHLDIDTSTRLFHIYLSWQSILSYHFIYISASESHEIGKCMPHEILDIALESIRQELTIK